MTFLPAVSQVDAALSERAVDPAEFVIACCERAKQWLGELLEDGSIEQIVEMKSQAEAIRVYTVQKNLGKDAELSAQEIVRRAERGIGLAIRKGQEAGTIRKPGDSTRTDLVDHDDLVSPRSFLPKGELYGSGTGPGIMDLADETDDEQFEEAITEAKEEGNLSRANVVRKVKGTPPPEPRSEFNRGRRHIDHHRVLGETITMLESLAASLPLVDISSIPDDERDEWRDQFRAALRPLNSFTRRMTSER